jgi:hypothetical protein
MDEKTSASHDLSLFDWCEHITWSVFVWLVWAHRKSLTPIWVNGFVYTCTRGKVYDGRIETSYASSSIVESIAKDRQNMWRANQVVVHAPHAKIKTWNDVWSMNIMYFLKRHVQESAVVQKLQDGILKLIHLLIIKSWNSYRHIVTCSKNILGEATLSSSLMYIVCKIVIRLHFL